MKRSIFFKTVTKEVWTWQSRVLFSFLALAGFILLLPLLKMLVPSYLIEPECEFPKNTPIVLENWTSEIAFFERAKELYEPYAPSEIACIIYDSYYYKSRRRESALRNAWAAGIDTTKLKWIVIPWKEPKTRLAAKAVSDSAVALGWKNFAILSFEMHSKRTANEYRRSAQALVKKGHLEPIIIKVIDPDINRSNWDKSGSGYTIVFSEVMKKIHYDFFLLGSEAGY